MVNQVPSRTVTYRKFMGPWGLLVRLTATYATESGALRCPEAVRVTDRICLRVLDKYATQEDTEYLVRGLRIMADLMSAAHPEGVMSIHVQELDYLPTDYQPEAAAAAIIEWVREEFGVEAPHIPVEFDRSTGYSFTWPESAGGPGVR